jgi:CRP-like cAMP-binding protein
MPVCHALVLGARSPASASGGHERAGRSSQDGRVHGPRAPTSDLISPGRAIAKATGDARNRRYSLGVDPAGILLQTPIFCDLSVQNVEELLPDLRERTYARGQPVWVEGDRAEELVIVAKGQLKAHRVSHDGREVILGLYPAVAVTGEVGLFHPRGTRWLGLDAMVPTRCLTLRRAPLLSFLARHPAAMQRTLEQLSIAAVQVANSLSRIAFDDIGRRVAGAMVALADEHGERTQQGTRIRLRLSQGELAAHVAASRENVNRALSAFIAAGVVSQQRDHFYIHDRAALKQAANTALMPL